MLTALSLAKGKKSHGRTWIRIVDKNCWKILKILKLKFERGDVGLVVSCNCLLLVIVADNLKVNKLQGLGRGAGAEIKLAKPPCSDKKPVNITTVMD